MSLVHHGLRIQFIVLILVTMVSAQSEKFGPFAVAVEAPVNLGAPPSPEHRPPSLRGAKAYDAEVCGQVFRPANPDPEQPLPVVVFLHGFSGQPLGYGVLLYHLASWGFVCVAVEDRTHASRQNPLTQALLAWTLADHVLDESAAIPFGAPIAGEGWAAVGHSMGAVGVFYLAAADPRIQTVVSISPYDGATVQPIGGNCTEVHAGLRFGWHAAVDAVMSFSGDVHILAGHDDPLTPPEAGRFWFERAKASAGEASLAIVRGMGHVAPLDHALTDLPLGVGACDALVEVGPMIGPDQHRLVRRFVGATLRAEIFGQEDLLREIHEPSFGGSVVMDRVLGAGLVDVELLLSR